MGSHKIVDELAPFNLFPVHATQYLPKNLNTSWYSIGYLQNICVH